VEVTENGGFSKNVSTGKDEGYTQLEMKALLLKRIRDKGKRLKRAKALMEQSSSILEAQREQIPDDVRIFVWRRDEGRCAKCGSRENLEFDHIIPVSKGGSNTARNIQLLCEKCNREKGDSII
jgi:5-methylcytosine-specific restriction endonuclease McrA